MNYAEQMLSDLAINLPMATEIFRRNRLDFCCGGKQTLKEACERKQIDLHKIISELKLLDSAPASKVFEKSLTEITSFIIDRYHNDLRRRLPELIALSEKVERVHGDHPSCPRGLTTLLKCFHEEMLMHMMKEENVLFPLINAGRGHMALMPVKVMTSEHDAHGRQLDELHELTADFNPPADGCGTWRALYKGLEKLEEELMDHIHLENNILFPRALNQQAG